MRAISLFTAVALLAATFGCEENALNVEGPALEVGDTSSLGNVYGLSLVPYLAIWHTDPPATVTPVPDGFALKKELGGYPNYGVADRRSDVLYSTEDDVWYFDMSAIPDPIVSATIVMPMVLDDHYSRPESDYVGTVTLNGQQVFSGGFSTDLGMLHGEPYGSKFNNWRSVSFEFSDLTPSTYTVAIQNNTPDRPGQPRRDWIAIDFMEIYVETAIPVAVSINVKPGDGGPKKVNLKSNGVIPVAILGSEDVEVSRVDVATLMFGPGTSKPDHDLSKPGVYAGHLKDVNDDGFTDLVSHYRVQEAGFSPGDTEACLEGNLISGEAITGCDAVELLGATTEAFFDDFSRSDRPLDGDNGWIEAQGKGEWRIISNEAHSEDTDDNILFRLEPVVTGDHSVEAVFKSDVTVNGQGLVSRFTLADPSNQTFYLGQINHRLSQISLWKRVNGAWTRPAGFTYSVPAAPVTVKMTIEDLSESQTRIDIFVNGVLELSYVDTNPIQVSDKDGAGFRQNNPSIVDDFRLEVMLPNPSSAELVVSNQGPALPPIQQVGADSTGFASDSIG